MDPASTSSTNISFEPAGPEPMPLPQAQVIQDPPISEIPTVVSPPPPANNANRKKVLAVFSVIALVLGIGAGVFLVRNRQLRNASAWNCSLYKFALSDTGVVSVQNGSSVSEPQQQANVYINQNLVETFSVPALSPGSGANLGTVSVPQNEAYSWRVDGTVDCENSGGSEQSGLSAQCLNVLAYDEGWTQLSVNDLKSLKVGDVVRFTVRGTTTQGSMSKARFSINGTAAVETTNKRPGTDEFYYEYKIPPGVNTFNIKAELFHSSAGWF